MVAAVYSYNAFGAVGDDTTDDTAAINNCHAAAVATGGEIQCDPGIYKITAALDPLNISLTDGYDGKQVSMRGYGGASRIRYHGADYGTPTSLFTVQSTGASLEVFDYFRDFIIECAADGSGKPPRLANTIGITFRNCAFMRVSNVVGRGCGVGIELDGVLSSQFYSVVGRQNIVGIYSHNLPSYSTNNANTFYSPLIGNNTQGGMDIIDGGCTIFTPNVEGNGQAPIEGTGTGYGIRQTHDAGQSGEEIIALNVYGGYFENNRGVADIFMRHNSPKYTKYNITSPNFRRIDTTNFVDHNIAIVHNGSGGLGYSERDCTFAGYNNYVPSINRKYRQITGTSIARRDLYAPSDNYYESQVETPPLYMPRTTII